MNNPHQELYPDKYIDPVLFLEHASVVALPFGTTEYLCDECGAHVQPGEVKQRGRCPFCEEDGLRSDRRAEIDIIAEQPGERRGVYTIFLRQNEAPDFFAQLDRTLRESFRIGLVAARGCDRAVAKALKTR